MTVITVVYASPRSCRRASTISRTSTGRPHSHNRSMITASSSPKRRIRTPEHGHANGVGRYLLSRIEQPYGSGLPPFFRPVPPAWPADRGARRPERLPVNITHLLSVLVDMAAITDAPRDGQGGDPDAVIRELYSHYAKALHGYVEQF